MFVPLSHSNAEKNIFLNNWKWGAWRIRSRRRKFELSIYLKPTQIFGGNINEVTGRDILLFKHL